MKIYKINNCYINKELDTLVFSVNDKEGITYLITSLPFNLLNIDKETLLRDKLNFQKHSKFESLSPATDGYMTNYSASFGGRDVVRDRYGNSEWHKTNNLILGSSNCTIDTDKEEDKITYLIGCNFGINDRFIWDQKYQDEEKLVIWDETNPDNLACVDILNSFLETTLS